MSRAFASSSDYLSRTAAIATAAPLSIGVIFKPTIVSGTQSLVSLGVSGTNNNRFSIAISTGGSIRAETRDASGTVTAFSGSAISAGSRQSGVAVFAASNSRLAYANGGNVGTDTTNKTPSGIGYTIVAKQPDSVNAFGGEIGLIAIWGAALTTDDALAFHSGVSPRRIQPGALLSCYPWLGSSEYDPIGQTTLTVNGTTVGTTDLNVAFNRGRRTIFLPLTTPTLGYTAAPAITATTSSAYTISVTPSGSCTFYAVAVKRGDSAPSATQIKAGQNSAGASAIASANKAITGADSLTLGGSLTRPIHDLYFVLNSGGTDSTVAVIASALLTPAAGKQFIVASGTSTTGYSIADSASPAVADGDIYIVDTAVAGLPISVRTNGQVVVAANGFDGRLQFQADVFDVSADALMGATTFTLNNGVAVATPNSTPFPQSFNLGAVIDLDLATIAEDPEGDPTTWSLVSGPSGAAVNTNHLTWTASGSQATFVLSVTDGLNPQQYTFTVDVLTFVAPNLANKTLAAAITTLAALGFTVGGTSTQTSTVPVGLVISQLPAANAIVNPGQAFTLVLSSGFIPAPTFSGTIADITQAIGDTAVVIDVGATFTGATSYAISPAVPAGWSFDTATGRLTTKTDIALARTFTVTGSVVGNVTTASSNAFTVTISAPVSGLAVGTPYADVTSTLNSGDHTVAVSGHFTNATSYALKGPLPSGWTFDTSTGLFLYRTTVTGTFGPFRVTASDGVVAVPVENNDFTVTISDTTPIAADPVASITFTAIAPSITFTVH
jgi:hypothetical protein